VCVGGKREGGKREREREREREGGNEQYLGGGSELIDSLAALSDYETARLRRDDDRARELYIWVAPLGCPRVC
jgi:hypothetical protein